MGDADSQTVIRQLEGVVGPDNVLQDPAELMAYECDGFPIAKSIPAAVVFLSDVDQTVRCVRILHENGVHMITRGSGTGLTGGCVAYEQGVILSTGRMDRVIEVDLDSRVACVEPGVRNLQLSEHVAALPGGERLYYAPDPSSQRASTIGGNTATNAGGLHTLKYGVTTNHVVGVELIRPDGTVIQTRCGGATDGMGPDLTALVCGSEGTLGIVTKVWVRLTPKPTSFRTAVAIYDSVSAASQTVTDVIATGIIPAALEMMDGPMIQILEHAFGYGFPVDAEAMLLIELDGPDAILDDQLERVIEICKRNYANDVQRSTDPEKREQLWKARKSAFGAIGQLSPSYCTQDACVPRSKLPEVMDRIMRIGAEHDLKITNVFHAGDGNVHPIILFDEDDAEQIRRVMQASHDILEFCIGIGGSLTGEHGVGVEKMPMMKVMFDAPTLSLFGRVKATIDPKDIANPGKLIPSEQLEVDLLTPIGANSPGGGGGVGGSDNGFGVGWFCFWEGVHGGGQTQLSVGTYKRAMSIRR
jgi:glycolate oxidase